MPEPGERKVDIRCPGGVLHYKRIDDECVTLIEFKCSHWFCTENGKYVALHRYSFDGELIETIKFADPVNKRPGARNIRKVNR